MENAVKTAERQTRERIRWEKREERSRILNEIGDVRMKNYNGISDRIPVVANPRHVSKEKKKHLRKISEAARRMNRR